MEIHSGETSPNYLPGEPLRPWDAAEPNIELAALLLIKSADARGAIERLVRSESLSVEDLLTFGRLNSWCVLQWREPMVMLIGEPQIDPALPAILRGTGKLDL
ncbi:MAG: hypothetical protein ACTJGR_05860 [Pauljensenia sp.]